jgi:hypothetical protein
LDEDKNDARQPKVPSAPAREKDEDPVEDQRQRIIDPEIPINLGEPQNACDDSETNEKNRSFVFQKPSREPPGPVKEKAVFEQHRSFEKKIGVSDPEACTEEARQVLKGAQMVELEKIALEPVSGKGQPMREFAVKKKIGVKAVKEMKDIDRVAVDPKRAGEKRDLN